MDLIPITVVDNFFDDPDSIRAEALTLDYQEHQNAPGARAYCPMHLATLLSKKVFSLLIDMNKHVVEGGFDINFQISPEILEEGWVHSDVNTYFAGVVYLTPNAPMEAGTSFYKPIDPENIFHNTQPLQKIKTAFYRGKADNLEEFKEARDKNNSFFYKTIDVGNVYNRLVLYPSNEFHKESKLFGTTKQDSRMTLVFFATHIASNSLFPIDRMKLIRG